MSKSATRLHLLIKTDITLEEFRFTFIYPKCHSNSHCILAQVLTDFLFAVDGLGMAAVYDDVKQVLDVQCYGDHGIWELVNYVLCKLSN